MRHKVEESPNSSSAPLFWHCATILALSRYHDVDRVVVAHHAVMVCGGTRELSRVAEVVKVESVVV